MKLVSATANPHKYQEMREILSGKIDLLPRPDEIPEIIEDALDLEGNALLKAQGIMNATGLPAIADDTGLEVDVLNGAPGVHSARYAGPDANGGENIEKLLTIAPDMGRAYQELGHLNRDSGNENSSITYYRQACELNPALLSSWNSLYNYFTKTKNKPAADHALDQIKTLKSIPANLLYISQILNEGRLGLAETKCREFLKKNPTHTYSMSQLADIASRLGYYDDAEFLLEKATSFEPNDADLRMKYLMVKIL